jgi:HSP20 family protein
MLGKEGGRNCARSIAIPSRCERPILEWRLLIDDANATLRSLFHGEDIMANITVQKRSGSPSESAIARREWEPFRAMRDLFRWDPFREMTPIFSGEVQAFAPAFEVKETKDSFVFKADVPGVKEQDLEVTTAGNLLTVTGKRESEKEEREDNFYAYERSYGSFTRSFTLPQHADIEHVHADLKSGELTIVIPKAAAAVAKRVPIASEKPKA